MNTNNTTDSNKHRVELLKLKVELRKEAWGELNDNLLRDYFTRSTWW